MRIIGILVFACGVLVQLGCADTCDDPNGCGKQGQSCRDFPAPNPCNSGLRCVDDVCVACGGTGEVCCWTAVGVDECDPGITCDESQDATPTCSSTCGKVGQDCCGDSCGSGAICNEATSTCELDPGGACGSGPAHFVEIVNELGCVVNEFLFNSNTPDDCVAAALAQLGPGFTAGPLDTAPTNCADKCQYWDDMPDASTGADPVHACAFGQQELDACFASLCTDCLYTNEPPNTCGDMY